MRDAADVVEDKIPVESNDGSSALKTAAFFRAKEVGKSESAVYACYEVQEGTSLQRWGRVLDLLITHPDSVKEDNIPF